MSVNERAHTQVRDSGGSGPHLLRTGENDAGAEKASDQGQRGNALQENVYDLAILGGTRRLPRQGPGPSLMYVTWQLVERFCGYEKSTPATRLDEEEVFLSIHGFYFPGR